VAAEKAADALVAKAHEQAARTRGEAQRDVEALEIRREEIKSEMARVQGVLDALAGPILRPGEKSAEPAQAGAAGRDSAS
jgi:hypothetical protein